GSIASFWSLADDSRSFPGSGHRYCRSACLKSANERTYTSMLAVCTQMGLCSTKSGYASISFMKMNGNSMRCFAFYGIGYPRAQFSPGAFLPSVFTRTYGGCDHATGQASFEAETHNQSRRRESARCRRTGSFAGG